MGRYQMVLAPCAATKEGSWGKVVASANSIVALWDDVGWRYGGLSWDQVIKIVDSKTGKEMTEKEYGDLVRKLKPDLFSPV